MVSSHSQYAPLPTEADDAAPLLADASNEFSAPNSPPPLYTAESAESKNIQYFNFSPSYPDRWATYAFALHYLPLVVIATLGVSNVAQNARRFNPDVPSDVPSRLLRRAAFGDDTDNPSAHLGHPAIVLFHIFAVGAFVSFAYLFALHRATKAVVYGAFFILTASFAAAGLAFAVAGLYAPAFVFLIPTLLMGFITFYWRKRIAFTAALLKSVSQVTLLFPGTVLSGILGLASQLVFLVVLTFLFTLGFGVFIDFEKAKEHWPPSEQEYFDINDYLRYQSYMTPYFFYFLFSNYWTSQVISSIVHVTVSGVTATVLLLGYEARTPNGSSKLVVPIARPTVRSAKRALTTSFGPIAFGALVIAIIQLILSILRSIRSKKNGGNVMAIVYWILEKVFSVFSAAFEFMNAYAFTFVATYGKSYIDAAKSTWELLKSRGLDLVINDSLTNEVLTVGGLVVGALCGLYAWVYVNFIRADDPELSDPKVIIPFGIAIVFSGLVQFGVLSTVLKAGACTSFVCLALEPETIQERQPEFYERVQETYPNVELHDLENGSNADSDAGGVYRPSDRF
ncbi:plasma-membrane choline transporter-domain-containing protein [Cladochytrium replicatum]|nr:plasma-membrane choline transporter-domain-containing protein [Cladochytrium replicatum]